MSKYSMSFFCCFLLLICLQLACVRPAVAGEKQERVQLLQQKMEKLQELLAKMQEAKLREQPPSEIPWQALLQENTERPAYDQYAYLLAPLMRADELDGILQQLHFFATQDELKERGTLFVVPATPLSPGEAMSVKNYNRDLAGTLLNKMSIPTAIEGGLIVAPKPLGQPEVADGSLLFIDLTGCDQILRSRMIGLLQSIRLFTEDGSIDRYLGELLRRSAPQAFTVYMQGHLVWLSLAKE
ncbi:hypothetical protein [uncultured Desulfuromusa sp.]|uniref:hypothetical protein n=1 Tax=uncultured Desulfuromusa sp. TaxID=219183 RepID=UPI002AA89258|nr:hypothetical protein [uncultured Desulfuromusa sp.]